MCIRDSCKVLAVLGSGIPRLVKYFLHRQGYGDIVTVAEVARPHARLREHRLVIQPQALLAEVTDVVPGVDKAIETTPQNGRRQTSYWVTRVSSLARHDVTATATAESSKIFTGCDTLYRYGAQTGWRQSRHD